MPERFIGGLPVSERMWKMYQEKGAPEIKGGSLESVKEEAPVPGTAETEDKKKEREQINQDLDLVLQRVSGEARSDTEKYHEFKKIEREAKERLTGEGVKVDAYLREGLVVGTREGNAELGKRKGVLRRIVAKMRAGENLADEEQEIADIVGLKKDTVMGAEEETKKPEERKEAKEGETKKTEEKKEDKGTERQPRKPSETEQKLANIAEYQSLVEQKAALERLRETLVRKGAPKSEIELVDKAMASLRVEEGKRIKESRDKGEMRPELKEALDRYYEELEKVYDSSVNMVNIYQMSLYEGTLTKALTEMKRIGADGEVLSEELGKELMDMGILHDLRLMINRPGPINEQIINYAAALKGEQFDRLIHLRNREIKGENDLVTQYLAKIDSEARKAYRDPSGDKTKVFSLEDPRLEGVVIGGKDKTKIDYLIARDLYRVTGGEARYGVMGYAHKDAKKSNLWVFEKNSDSTNNGAVFRKVLNMRRELFSTLDTTERGGYRPKYYEKLWSHLDSGMASFWEKLWVEAKAAGGDENIFKTEPEISIGTEADINIPPREYAVLTVEALRNLSLGKERPGTVSISNEIKFNSWMDSIGKMAGTVSKETAYLSNPSIKSFQSIFGDKDTFMLPITVIRNGERVPLEKQQYLLEVLGDLVAIYKESGVSLNKVSEGLDEYLSAGFIFSEEQTLNEFKRKHGIPETQKEKDSENTNKFFGDLVSGKGGGEVAKNAVADLFKRILGGGF